MTIPIIGNAKELDSQTIENHRIVAVFGICSNTLCIQDHALQRYVSRGHLEESQDSTLAKLYSMLSISLIVERKNERKQIEKYGKRAMYRFEDGWIFVLTWVKRLQIWLVETAIKKEESQLRVYDIKRTREAIRASAWSPTLAWSLSMA